MSDQFGVENDNTFKAAIGDIYQSFAGKDLYPSQEEKEKMTRLIMIFLFLSPDSDLLMLN